MLPMLDGMGSDILPCLGARPVREIEPLEIVAVVDGIEKRGARGYRKTLVGNHGIGVQVRDCPRICFGRLRSIPVRPSHDWP